MKLFCVIMLCYQLFRKNVHVLLFLDAMYHFTETPYFTVTLMEGRCAFLSEHIIT